MFVEYFYCVQNTVLEWDRWLQIIDLGNQIKLFKNKIKVLEYWNEDMANNMLKGKFYLGDF